MKALLGLLLALALALGMSGCSLALDFDALGRGQDTASSDPGPVECTADEDCADGIDCTLDSCGADGLCEAPVPDNDLCGPLEMCKRGTGCVPTGDECEVAADCDDGHDCTKERCDLGQCRHLPRHELCEAADPCIEGDVCDTDSGCLAGAPLACEQVMEGVDLTCRHVLCDPTTGGCDLVVLQSGADDDSDSAFDEACGGDDCDDMNSLERPSAPELCDFQDNDCDGLTDLKALWAPVALESSAATSLGQPMVASDGALLAVAWQDFAGASADIKLVFLDDQGVAATGQASLGVLLGTSADLRLLFLGSDDARVLLALAEGSGAGTSLRVLGVSADTAGAAVSLSGLDVEVDSGQEILDAVVAADPAGSGGGGFAMVYAVLGSAGSAELLAVGAEDIGAGGPASLATGSWTAAQLELVRTSARHFVAAVALADPVSGDTEVYVAELATLAEGTSASALAPLSRAHELLSDPSTSPRAALVSDEVLVAWTDIASTQGGLAVESEADIRAAFLADPAQEITLVSDNAVNQRLFGAVAMEEDLGLLFGQATASSSVLDFRWFDAELEIPGEQAGRLAHVDQGELLASRLVSFSPGLAVAWIETALGKDALWVVAFDRCEVP